MERFECSSIWEEEGVTEELTAAMQKWATEALAHVNAELMPAEAHAEKLHNQGCDMGDGEIVDVIQRIADVFEEGDDMYSYAIRLSQLTELVELAVRVETAIGEDAANELLAKAIKQRFPNAPVVEH